jgi:polyisoprenoid-binding protein YceI
MTTTSQSLATYAIDASHSNVEFTARHMVITKVRGRFGKFTGTLTIADGAEVPTAVSVEIETASVDTRDEQRDTHLRSGDFLETEKYPAMTFVGTKIAGSGPSFTITGDLTLHGVTKPVTLDAEYEGRGKDPWGNERISFGAKTKINRKEFGLTWSQTLETGGLLVSDEIAIELEIQGIRQA